MPERMRWGKRPEVYYREMVEAGLTQRGWSAEDSRRIAVNTSTSLDGSWSFGTLRAIRDLDESYELDHPMTKTLLRAELRGYEWTPLAIESIVDFAADGLFGLRSMQTKKAIEDLLWVHGEIMAREGDPPDVRW